MEEAKEEEKKEDPTEGKVTLAQMQELAKSLKLQEERINDKILTLDKERLAFNVEQREAKISGKTLAVEKTEEKPKDTPEEYADKVMKGEANPLKDDKIIP